MDASPATARRAELRERMRAQRAGLESDDCFAHAMAVMTRLARLEVLHEARIVAGYRAVRGEVEIDAPLQLAAERGSVLTLPRVVGERLEFVTWTPGAPSRTGAFGIPEPADGEIVAAGDHDLLLVPVVAFDRAGHRLGQGGGYYDRALGELRGRPLGTRPTLIGIAHAFQEVAELPTEPWDVGLDAVITEDDVHTFTPGATTRI